MFQEAPGLEQRLAELQAQIDRLTISLQLWRDGQERLTPADERLSRFADEAAELLHDWSALGDRHARVVDVLEQQVASFGLAESRLQQESAQRFLTLERMLQQEWATLRELRLEPAGERRDQIVELTQACVTAASGAAPAPPSWGPLHAAERELQDQWSTLLASPALAPSPVSPLPVPVLPALASSPSLSASQAAASPPPAEPIDIDLLVERVLERLAPLLAAATPTPAPPAPEPMPAAPSFEREELDAARAEVARTAVDVLALRSDLGGRITTLQLHLDEAEVRALDAREEQRRVTRRLSFIMVLLLAVLAGGAWWAATMQRQMVATTARLIQVEQQSARAASTAAEELTATRAQLERIEATARRTSAEAELTGAVLAAPDLLRYGLSATDGSSTSAQLLWSRSRGIVFSAARLGALYPESTYQVWLLSGGTAISAGTLTPDDSGRATLVTDALPRVPGPVTGVSLTIEPSGGSQAPSERLVAANRIVRSTP